MVTMILKCHNKKNTKKNNLLLLAKKVKMEKTKQRQEDMESSCDED